TISLVPHIVTNLANVQACHALKGTLYVLIGKYCKRSMSGSPLLDLNWSQAVALWPALVGLNFAEKPEIAMLIDSDIVTLFTKQFTMFPIRRNLMAKLDVDLLRKAHFK